jgi:hypothetical protein
MLKFLNSLTTTFLLISVVLFSYYSITWVVEIVDHTLGELEGYFREQFQILCYVMLAILCICIFLLIQSSELYFNIFI